MICIGGDWGWEKGGDRPQGSKFGEDHLLSEFSTPPLAGYNRGLEGPQDLEIRIWN